MENLQAQITTVNIALRKHDDELFEHTRLISEHSQGLAKLEQRVSTAGLNPNALNETLRILIRMLVPFCILMVLALLTRPNGGRSLDLFFVKMKTEVRTDPEADAREIELSQANPNRFNHKKLFPNSSWELDRWDKTDMAGFVIAVAAVFSIIYLMKLLVSLGG